MKQEDLIKIEKLSCLSVNEKDKEYYSNSLDSVLSMMHDIDKLDVSNIDVVVEKSQMRIDKVEDNLVDICNKIDGLHVEDGYFLAPKVINK